MRASRMGLGGCTTGLVVALLATVGGCSSGDVTRVAGTSGTTGGKSDVPTRETTADDFTRQTFSRSSVVDNRYLPLRPGTRLVYEGKALDEGEPLARRVVFTVTDLAKQIAGVAVLVAWDQDYNDGVLVESDLTFLAQDDDGNVWHVGEYPEEYEDGKIVAAPTWVHGVDGATAGLDMLADPRPGSADYAQGFAPPPIDWVDRARVHKRDASTCVPVRCYDDVLVTEEFEADKPGAAHFKYYAPGVGNVRVGWSGPLEEEQEVLQLVEARMLDASEMAEARRAVLAQDARGYRVSRDVYVHTTPAR